VTNNDEVSSTSEYVFTLGGRVVSWKSSKKTCIARSTMEYKFIVLELVGKKVEWLKNLLGDITLWGLLYKSHCIVIHKLLLELPKLMV